MVECFLRDDLHRVLGHGGQDRAGIGLRQVSQYLVDTGTLVRLNPGKLPGILHQDGRELLAGRQRFPEAGQNHLVLVADILQV